MQDKSRLDLEDYKLSLLLKEQEAFRKLYQTIGATMQKVSPEVIHAQQVLEVTMLRDKVLAFLKLGMSFIASSRLAEANQKIDYSIGHNGEASNLGKLTISFTINNIPANLVNGSIAPFEIGPVKPATPDYVKPAPSQRKKTASPKKPAATTKKTTTPRKKKVDNK